MTHLFLVDLATKVTRPLTSGPFVVGSFEWSPDGSYIAFQSAMANPAFYYQGGYISAFLATHDSARFKAISVGAGISVWMTRRKPVPDGRPIDVRQPQAVGASARAAVSSF
jgi:hypothetical protein